MQRSRLCFLREGFRFFPGLRGHMQLLSYSILQQLQRDQAHAVAPDKSQFRSLGDAVHRLLSYHVCQGSMPSEEDLSKGNPP